MLSRIASLGMTKRRDIKAGSIKEVEVGWVEWSPPSSSNGAMVRSLLRAVYALHSSLKNEVWLWRGEAVDSYVLEPGMHTRIRNALAAGSVVQDCQETDDLITLARHSALDRVDGVVLPDLALLAHLQHHGAATPLLDVSVDPLVSLWMVVNASGDNVNGSDSQDGKLIAIRRPPPSRWLDPFDGRPFAGEDGSVCGQLRQGGLYWYRPPEVSERLRIQRGSFVLGRFEEGSDLTTLPIHVEAGEEGKTWLAGRIDQTGQPGRRVAAATEAVVFRVPRRIKGDLREWLDERAGLSRSVIYPTPWNRPHLEAFCSSHTRQAPLHRDALTADKLESSAY